MTDFDVIKHLEDNKWSSEVQDAMIEFINYVTNHEPKYKKDILESLVKRYAPDR